MANVIGPSLGSRPGSRRLCILSGRPLQAREFVEMLEIELSPHDEIEFIRDRRRSSGRRPSLDRRREGPVDSWLEKHQFAIVPAALPSERPGRRLMPPQAAAPAERVAARVADSDESRLERIRRVGRRRRLRFCLQLIVGGLAGITIGVTLANFMLPTVGTVGIVISRVRAMPTTDAQRTNEPPPPVVSPVAQALPPISAPSVTEPSSLTVSAPSVSEVSRPTLPDRVARPPISPPENREADRPRDVRPAPHVGPHPSVVIPLPEGRAFKPVSSQSGGLPTLQMERRPAPASEGGGEVYALRLSDTAGQSLAGAEVSLFIRMADGALLDLPAQAGPTPGIYQVTVPPLQSAPVDLRVRVATSDTRVEIPLAQ
jgi:hypothetical protein